MLLLEKVSRPYGTLADSATIISKAGLAVHDDWQHSVQAIWLNSSLASVSCNMCKADSGSFKFDAFVAWGTFFIIFVFRIGWHCPTWLFSRQLAPQAVLYMVNYHRAILLQIQSLLCAFAGSMLKLKRNENRSNRCRHKVWINYFWDSYIVLMLEVFPVHVVHCM